ncbi:MAG: hypothetical protein FWD57_05255, partial [Polyangiaceae bacterium]|nr:hypothetical protein [Polyangiaceae bacterium]
MPRPIMALFFVVDTSGSMDGEYIGALNAALSEVIPDIRDLSETNPDAQIKVGVLEYSCGAEWLTPAG